MRPFYGDWTDRLTAVYATFAALFKWSPSEILSLTADDVLFWMEAANTLQDKKAE